MQNFLSLTRENSHGGSLEFILPSGSSHVVGEGAPAARVLLRDTRALLRILLNPELAFGETYMEGLWSPADGELLPVLRAALGIHAAPAHGVARQWRRLRALAGEFNTRRRSRRNARHHYDLDFDLYRSFLDADLHYSCAYFRDPGMSLEAAQQAKCAHIAAKLDLRPGAQVLDIGCGWGSLAMHLAQHGAARVLGITLSPEQLEVARERARARGLSQRVEFRLQDYREVRGSFDAVVSVGMFEHVGRPQYAEFFRRVRELTKPDGVALVHSIGRRTPPGSTNAWVRKYIFPGGYTPAASEMMGAVEHSGLIATDLEIWRLHYAQTLAHWHARFQRARAAVRRRTDERFCRMWEFYLQACEASFRWDDLQVFQLQLIRQQERLPLTREYLYARESPAAESAHLRRGGQLRLLPRRQ